MAELEKVYCVDRNNGNNDPLAMMAAMNGGMGGQWNNPFIYLVWMMFAGRFFGNNGMFGGNDQSVQNAEFNTQLQDIRSQLQNNQNSNLVMDAIKGNAAAISQLASNLNCDFNTLNACCCDVRNGINKLSGEVGFSAERIINAVNIGDSHVIEALNRCCCETQKELLRMDSNIRLENCEQTNILQKGQSENRVAIDKGFGEMGYALRDQTCRIEKAISESTQTIMDKLNSNKIEELQRENSALRQEKQMFDMFQRYSIPHNYYGRNYNPNEISDNSRG